jgi:hypothetical protein
MTTLRAEFMTLACRARWRGFLNTAPAAERLIVIERSWGKARSTGSAS